MRRVLPPLAAICFCFLVAGISQAQPIINNYGLASPTTEVTFEEPSIIGSFVIGVTDVTTQYSGYGVTFENLAFVGQGWPAPPYGYPGMSNNYVSNYSYVIWPPGTSVSIRFTVPVSEAAIGAFTPFPSNTTFTALSGGSVVESFTATTSQTDPNGFYGFTGISFDQIQVSVAPYMYLWIDNIKFNPQISNKPVAEAGPDIIGVDHGPSVSITLDGSGSKDANDPNGINPLTYAWSFISIPPGSGAVLTNANTISPSFVADLPGRYTVSLVVTNSSGIESNPDTVAVDTTNTAPVAEAGLDQVISLVGQTVQLNGGGTDINGDSVTYSWEFNGFPTGSNPSLSGSTIANPTFVADVNGTYIVRLTVVDDHGIWSTPDTVTISFNNIAPMAEAGPDQVATYIGQMVELNGTQSHDDNGESLIYSWTFGSIPLGSSAQFSNPTGSVTTFVADVHGDYKAILNVHDINGLSAEDSVTVTFNNAVPVANAGTNQSVSVGTTVTLNGSASSDANLDPLTYRWSFVSYEGNTPPTLSNSTAVNPTFTADLVGDYVVSLVVNDGFVDSAPNNVTVTAVSNTADPTVKLKEAIDAINALAAGDFKNPNMRNALTNKINAVLSDIEKGLYTDAISKLQNDIMNKTNGCAAGGAPDKNDWIVNCGAQNPVYLKLQEALDLLWGM